LPQSPASAAAQTLPDAAAPSAPAGVSQASDAATPAASPQQAADVLPVNAPPEEYLKKAQTTFGAGDIASTLSILDKFRSQYPLGNDEAWWLYAQAFEANSPDKDIRSAQNYYQRLVREYPLSSHYADAQSRIKYINKYYFNIQ
jgi:outer membrane protein assembly factor BamD (BamD/ComL family)